MSNKVYVNDTGTAIVLDCVSNISGATIHQIKYKKPSGAVGVWNAEIVDTTHIKHITEDGDLDEEGYSDAYHWEVQAYIEMASWEGHGQIAKFLVYPVLA